MEAKTSSSEGIKNTETYICIKILKDKGFNGELKKVKSFKKLLRIRRGKKGGNWIYTIEGFVNEEYIKGKYGIDEIKY